MNVTVNRAEFQRALASCAAIVNKRSLPILQCALLSAGDKFTIASTDLDLTLCCTIPDGARSIAEPGQVAINLETLHEFARNAPEDSIALSTEKEGRLSVVSGNAKFALPTISADDFPTVPSRDNTSERTAAVDMRIIASGYGAVLYASGDGVQTAPNGAVMAKGALIRAKDGLLEFCSTDGVRLARASIAIGEGAEIADVTPVKAARMVMRLSDGGPCLISETINHVFVECESYAFAYRRSNVSFPNFEYVLRVSTGDPVAFDRAQCLGAVRRVSMLSPNDNGVSLKALDGMLRIAPIMGERGDGSDSIPCDAGELGVSLSGRYLLQALESIAAERVSLSAEPTGKMVVVRSVGGDESEIQSIHCLATRKA